LSLRQRQVPEAQRWLEKGVDFSGPKEFRPGFALVDLHLRTRDHKAALEAAKKLLARAPEQVTTQVAYARTLLAMDDAVGARPVLTNAARFAGYDATALTEIASLQSRARDLPGAVYSLEKALSGDARNLPALIQLARAYLDQGDLTRAEQRGQQAAQQFPRSADAQLVLADVALVRSQFPQALEAAKRAHALMPSAVTVLKQMQINATAGDKTAAVKLAQDWLQQKPQDLAVLRALGNTYSRQGNAAAAETIYDRLLVLAPNDVQVLNNLANVQLQRGDKKALSTAQRAFQLAPSDPSVIDTLGWAQQQQGDPEKALPLLRDARLRAPQNPDIRYHLAAVLAGKGRKAEARSELEAALQGNHGFESEAQARQLLEALK